MQGTQFVVSQHITGTLAANVDMRFTFPFPVQLIAVSAVGSNANNGILDIGPSTDTDGYLDGKDIGDSQVPAVFDKDDFVGTEFPHIAANTVICASLDFDGAGGTAAHDYTLVMVFTEG
jgi:hypothetical protein